MFSDLVGAVPVLSIIIDLIQVPMATAVLLVTLYLRLAPLVLALLFSSFLPIPLEVQLVALPKRRLVSVEQIALGQNALQHQRPVVHSVRANSWLRHAVALVKVLHRLAHAVLVERLVSLALTELGLLGFELVDRASLFGELNKLLAFNFKVHFVYLPEELCLLLINLLGSLGLAS